MPRIVARPYQQFLTDKLAALALDKQDDPAVLHRILKELRFRESKRAKALAGEVEKLLSSQGSGLFDKPPQRKTGAILGPVQPDIFDIPVPGGSTAPGRTKEPMASDPSLDNPASNPAGSTSSTSAGGAVKSPPIRSATPMSLREAMETLKLTTIADWASVEAARAAVVGRASPLRLLKMVPERRLELERLAQHANSAYLTLARVLEPATTRSESAGA